jgi:hypothetical protein
VRSVRAGLALAAVLAVAAVGCNRGDARDAAAPPRCDVPLTVPEGFRTTGGIEDPQDDRVGVRIDLRSDDGRELHYFSGIRGEFGEGLPDRGDVPVTGGAEGHLAGEDASWVLEWETEPPCTPTAVLGTGMKQSEFRALLREAGAIADE